ncbi:nSTAND1 domain-containing NTPase [Streptomyces hydrogenans]|uniref:nSTAND1 domain-containing NTPase n=1 Tax=Streptomyces hydrogenans TaxID=1873719 RepID=UPI00332FD8C1
MGRRERPLDPEDGPVERFAHELRMLRRKAGLTYRAMAVRAHYSPAALAQAAAGDRLATLPVALAYADVCGGDPDEWAERWREASRELTERVAAADDPAGAPYLGLARFEAADRELFFGRDRLVAGLVELVRARRVVALVGPSGCGKSSLLRAGLAPALREVPGPDRPTGIHVLTPGPRPVETHARLLAPDGVGRGAVLLVDQFEEAFTLCADGAERDRFVELLLAAAEPGRGARVVIAVRADFFGHCAALGPLAEAVRDSTQLVTPMTPDELRDVVVRPAAARGLVVERALTARIVRDLADEPGGLPLLSHALRETWRRRHGRTLAESAYDAAGGMRGALARTAEEFYAGLTSDQAATARRVLLRLVAPGQGTQDTRRPADRAEFEAAEPDTTLVLEQLARARLVTLAGTTVDLAHEALLTAWPRLRGWIDDDRERLRHQRRLTEAAGAWLSLGRDEGALYRGVRLSSAEERFPGGGGVPDDLTSLEREFLTASSTAHGRERRRRRSLAAAVCVVLVLALTAGLAAWQQSRVGERRRAESEARRIAGVASSLRLTDPRTAMRLGLAAWRLADLPETRSAVLSGMAQRELDAFSDPDGDPRAVRNLGSDARTLTTLGRDRVLVRDVATGRILRSLPGLGEDVDRIGLKRGDGDLVTSFPDPLKEGDAGRVAVRDLSGRRPDLVLGRAAGGAEMSPTGRQVVGYDHTATEYVVTLWDARSGRRLIELRAPRNPRADATGTQVWDATLRRQARERRPLAPDAPDVTVSRDGRTLAFCVPGRPLELWDVARRKRATVGWTSDRECYEERYRFVAGDRLLAHAADGDIQLRDLVDGTERPSLGYRGELRIGLSTDDRYLAAHTATDVLLWRLDTPEWPVVIHAVNGEYPAEPTVDPKSGRLRFLAGAEPGSETTVRTLDVSDAIRADWRPGASLAARFSPDGRFLAVAEPPGADGTARFGLLDGSTGAPIAGLPGLPCRTRDVGGAPPGGGAMPPGVDPPCQVSIAYRPDGGRLAYSTKGLGFARRIGLWDVGRQRPVARAAEPPDRWGGIALTPDDRVVLRSSPSGIEFWDPGLGRVTGTVAGPVGDAFAVRPGGRSMVTSSGESVDLRTLTTVPRTRNPGTAVQGLEFSADGRYLAAAKQVGRVTLWDGGLERGLGVLTRADLGGSSVSALAFSPDGRTLAVAHVDDVIQLWDLDSRMPVGSPIPTVGGLVHDLAFSPDGTVLRVAGARTPLQRIEVTPAAAAADVCRRAGGGLSPEEWRTHVNGLPYRSTC